LKRFPLHIRLLLTCLFFIGSATVFAQYETKLTVKLNEYTKELDIKQEFVYYNDSNFSLGILYFNDWAHAYSDKNTGLAKRFAQEFKRSLHLAKKSERGYTTIISAVDSEYVGYDNKGEYYLKDWYLTPAVYDGKWRLYSNKNLEDLYTNITRTTIDFTYPDSLHLVSNLNKSTISKFPGGQHVQLSADAQRSAEILLQPNKNYTTHVTPHFTVVTDISAPKYSPIGQGISITKVADFIYDNLGDYPHKKLLVSDIDYDKDPLYGLNQLPSFIRPYEEQFQFEMIFLKTALNSILKETMFLNPRKEQWLNSAIANYLMIAFVEKYYPDQKMLGKLARIWGVRSFNLAKMEFNDQYSFLYNLTARKNLDQALSTSNDSLIKFNQKIANKYKAGLGLAYLADYIGKEKVDESIKTFFKYYQLNKVKVLDFESILKRSTNKDINWFFKDYVSTDRKIDFKIRKVRKSEDSLSITIKNKEGTNVPISMFGLKKDSVISKYWFKDISDSKTFQVANNGEDKLVLNYDQKIPEFNQRDNWKSLGGFLSSNKKLHFTFFKDSENPYYNQVFYVPVVNFNIYDGWAPGLRLYNKTLLERPFVYDFAPSYSFREKAFVGYGRFSYRKYLSKSGLYVANYSLNGSTSHFNVNSRVISFTPSFSLGFRPSDLISNKREFLSFRYINIFRDFAEGLQNDSFDPENPDYRVFNARYINRDNDILDYKSWFVDFQLANNFSKLSFEYEYRKLFENNRQLNLRFFAGKFLSNRTGSDFFSFALDRPTDYLFDYWLATTNASFNIWRWIELYGDAGLVKNKGLPTKFVYDSGIRLNLVTDYFELYLPLHSNNGWEIAQPDYGERIRFIVTVDIKTITGLFTRQWF